MARISRNRHLGAGVFILCATCASSARGGGLIISSVVGGAPTGVNYVNYDNLAPGSAGGTSGGVGVSFDGSAGAVTGSLPNVYAAPFLSNHNGALFGDATVAGPDSTVFLTTGTGSVTLTLPGPEKYVGLLWGSVDTFNSLSFYDASNNLIGTITGTDVTASANGDQGASGTFYVNINSTESFVSVVASSPYFAFEFDNFAFNPAVQSVPEPASLVTGGAGALAVLAACWVRRKRETPARWSKGRRSALDTSLTSPGGRSLESPKLAPALGLRAGSDGIFPAGRFPKGQAS